MAVVGSENISSSSKNRKMGKLATIDIAELLQNCVSNNNNNRLSGTTRVGRYQKKHSPAYTHPGNVLPLSPFSICNGPWHPLYSAYVLDSPLELHTLCISSPSHHHLFAAHAHTNAACSAAI